MERFPCPICAWSTKSRNSNCAMWTWNSPRVITDHALWRQKPPRVSRCMRDRKTHRVCVAFSTNVRSPQESSIYEHCTHPSRCPESSRLHRSRGSVSLHRSDAFGLLCGTPVSRLHRRPLGQAHDPLLEQTSHQEACPDRMFSKKRNGLSPVLPASLPPDRPREHSQPARTRNRTHPAAHRHARFRSPESGVSVPRNRARKSPFFLQSIKGPESVPALEDLSRTKNFPAHRPLLRR